LKYYRAFKHNSFKDFFKTYIIKSHDTNFKLALSVLVGVFMGIAPIWGYQLALAITLAYVLKLNKPIVVLTANISLPPMIPLLVYISYKFGGWVLNSKTHDFAYYSVFSLQFIKTNVVQYIVGSLCLGTISSISLSLLTYFLLSIFRKKEINFEKV
jgi:uncharacterized protein (DUF2062 family)